MTIYSPPVGFYFSLSFPDDNSLMCSFQEASGLSVEMDVEEIAEGGENAFKHKVPTENRYPNLVLKRGLTAADSPLLNWCTNTIGSDFSNPISPKTIQVSLMNAEGTSLKTWNFVNAWPVKWSISDFKSQESEVVVEALEFAYSYFTTENKKL